MKRASGIAAVAAVLALIACLFVFHWLGMRLYHDFFPPDASAVGPNLVASVVQWVAIALVMAVVYPPFRKWVEGELDHIHQRIDHLSKHVGAPHFQRDHGFDRNHRQQQEKK